MLKEKVTDDILIYSLRRQQHRVNELLNLPENTVIENAYFIGNALTLNVIRYNDFEILPRYTILATRSEPTELLFHDNDETVENMYKSIIMYNKPESRRLDVFFCTMSIAFDKENRLYKYIQKKYNDIEEFDDYISILNIDIDHGNVIIALSVNGKNDFILFTGEEFLALYGQNKTNEYKES